MSPRTPGKRRVKVLSDRARGLLELYEALPPTPLGERDTAGAAEARKIAKELGEVVADLERVPETALPHDLWPLVLRRDNPDADPSEPKSVVRPADPDSLLLAAAGRVCASADQLMAGTASDYDREVLRSVLRLWMGIGTRADDLPATDLRDHSRPPAPPVLYTNFVDAQIGRARKRMLGWEWLRERCTSLDERFGDVPRSEWEDAATGKPWRTSPQSRRPADLKRAAFIVLTALGSSPTPDEADAFSGVVSNAISEALSH